jgi:hypothetical protein
MTEKIAQRGFLDLIASEVGPTRKVRIHSFRGRSDTGFIPVPMLKAGCPPIAVVNISSGLLEPTGHFIGTVTGGLSQDTGAGNAAANTYWAIETDTGAIGV